MEKIRVLFKTSPNHPKGYGTSVYPTAGSAEVFEKLCEIIPKGKKMVEHFIDSEWVETPWKDEYNEEKNYLGGNFAKDVPRGNLNYYLTVFVE